MDLKVQRMEHQLEIEIQEAFLRWDIFRRRILTCIDVAFPRNYTESHDA